MHILRRNRFGARESEVTPEGVWRDRRRLMAAAGAGAIGAALAPRPANALFGLFEGGSAESADDGETDPTADLYPAERNPRFAAERAITDESFAATYNNFYEFGSHKRIFRNAQNLDIRPWTVAIDGMVEKEREIGIDDLIRGATLEERIYRLRCVEAWAMTVPWTGFPLKHLVELARPLSSAKYVRMETFLDPEVASGQRARWYPWPYVEGLTMAEATHPLAFLVTGVYGKPLEEQFGAPLRLAVPWKYGFKSVKSIVRFTFTDERPTTFWESVAGNEYGFWANVNPEVPHPRWSQAEENLLGTDRTVPTRLYNGYAEEVAHLYEGLDGERLFM